jgi:hypothetical protein
MIPIEGIWTNLFITDLVGPSLQLNFLWKSYCTWTTLTVKQNVFTTNTCCNAYAILSTNDSGSYHWWWPFSQAYGANYQPNYLYASSVWVNTCNLNWSIHYLLILYSLHSKLSKISRFSHIIIKVYLKNNIGIINFGSYWRFSRRLPLQTRRWRIPVIKRKTHVKRTTNNTINFIC